MLPAIRPNLDQISALGDHIQRDCDVDIDILRVLGPTCDLFIQNPFSMRIAFRAIAQGRRFVHHELRGYIPVPKEMEPEIPVWEYEQNTPLWIGGVRRNPKHFCFRLDAIFPTFHPNYRSKWPAHELLHSLCGYYWHPEQTRFECYVGARLAELLPLTHWYGFDEVVRERCAEHRGKPPSEVYCRTCESMFGEYWNVDWTPLQQSHSLRALEFAHAYYKEERDACIREIETVRRHAIPRILLDSSSDALGYLEGHWNRLCSWSFGAFDDLFVRKEERHDSLDDFLEHIDTLFSSLLHDDVSSPTIEEHEEQFKIRQIQDLGKRVLVALEWGSDADRDSCWPLLVQAADSIHHSQELDIDAWVQELKLCMNTSSVSQSVLEPLYQTGLLGDSWDRDISVGFAQSFSFGLSENDVEHLVSHPSFWTLGHLWTRAPSIVNHDSIRLEGWLKQAPHEDREARLFSMPYSLEQGVLRINTTIREGHFSTEAMEEVLGWAHQEPIIAYWNQGAPVVLVLDAELRRCMEAVPKETWKEEISQEYIQELVSIGLFVWIPNRIL